MKKIYLSILMLFVLKTGVYAQNANTSLSNLNASTAVNHTLQPNTTASKNLGSLQKKWKNLYLSGSLNSDSATINNGLIVSNGGISGFNSNGTGVYGSGGSYGVYGNGTFYGLWGNADTIGVFGLGNDYGIYGQTHNGTGVYGISLIGNGVCGTSSSGYGGSFTSTDGTALKASSTNGPYAGEFDGDVYTTGSYTASDRNLKQNIRDFSGAMSIINKLKPKYYDFKDDSKYVTLHLPKGDHYGLLAQDLEEVLPDLVKESDHEIGNTNKPLINPSAYEKPLSAVTIAKQQATTKESITIKAVNYTELIPIMIKGMQELSAKNDEKDKLISDLQNQVKSLKDDVANLKSQADQLLNIINQKNNITLENSTKGFLIYPNPANGVINISSLNESSSGNKKVIFQNIAGKIINSFSMNNSNLSIPAKNISPGIYVVNIYQNNSLLQSEKVVVK